MSIVRPFICRAQRLLEHHDNRGAAGDRDGVVTLRDQAPYEAVLKGALPVLAHTENVIFEDATDMPANVWARRQHDD